jgi:hypothetical protein
MTLRLSGVGCSSLALGEKPQMPCLNSRFAKACAGHIWQTEIDYRISSIISQIASPTFKLERVYVVPYRACASPLF